MIQTDIDHLNSNEKNYFSSFSSKPQPITWTNTSFIPIHTIDKAHIINDSNIQNLSSLNNNNNHLEDDNIDWDFVSKQFEIKLRTSSDITQSKSTENSHTTLPPKISKQYQFHPIKNHEFTAIQQTSQNNENTITYTTSSVKKQNIITNEKKSIPNQIEINTSLSHSSILYELLDELNICQQKQAFLIKQIQQFINQSQQIPSLKFFVPLNSLNNSQTILSLQDAFQQRKSSFIQRSKKRINQIYRQNNKYHHRIIPNIKQTNNTYLQERRQYENDCLCSIIIKHQNRQNAKIYGNLIKNQLSHH